MDKLERMMEMQEHLNTNVIKKLDMKHYRMQHADSMTVEDLSNDKNKREWADKFMSALQAEVCETRESLTQNVKWWKNKTKDQAGVEDEIVDCFHFLMSAALAMGMTAEDVYSRYCEKNKANFTRQDWDVNQQPQQGL